MKSWQISLKNTPIVCNQTSLNNFFSSLVNKPKKNLIGKLQSRRVTYLMGKPYKYELTQNDCIIIKDTHCHTCGKRLRKNGTNKRKVILDNGLGEHRLRLHRKRCPKCGEIPFEINNLAPKNGNYNETLKKKARQLAMKGFITREIRDSMEILLHQWVPKSSIEDWLAEPQEELAALLKDVPPPSSGYYGYDEIHLRINGEKWYAMILYDLKYKVPVYIKHVNSLDRREGKKFLSEARRRNKVKYKAIVKDGGKVFGGLFQKRGYDYINVQLCHVHMKWNINRYIKEYCDLPKESKKPIPNHALPIRNLFHKIIESPNETAFYSNVEALRPIIEKKNHQRLTAAFNKIQGIAPRLLEWHNDPNIPKTNNNLERENEYLERNRSYKRHMKTAKGAERAVHYMILGQIMRAIIIEKLDIIKSFNEWSILKQDPEESSFVKHQGNHFSARRRRVDNIFEKYFAFLNNYIII